MKIIRWERQGDLYVGIDQHGWKRAVIIPDANVYYGYAPLGFHLTKEEVEGRNLRSLKRQIQTLVREV